MSDQDTSVPASPSGLRPFGAEPAAQSQAEPLVPNAECSHCGAEKPSSAGLCKCGRFGAPGFTAKQLATAVSRLSMFHLTALAEFDARALYSAALPALAARKTKDELVALGLMQKVERLGQTFYGLSHLGESILAHLASGIEGEAGDPKGLHPEGESPAPEGGDAQ